jgi:nitroimidazol reductase NimA-like FMN-containing flavoprotein (pyridoxamine 5'-phosphate oxidase superfamily)
MLDRITSFLEQHHLCVLATVRDGAPHCSLMAYVTGSESRTVYMATYRDTGKFSNLTDNPRVSLLIDDRCAGPEPGRRAARALTVHGDCRPVENPKTQERIRERLVEKRPDMRDFVSADRTAVVEVRIRSFLFMEGVTGKSYVEV